MTRKMTKEYKEFLQDKSEVQLEHIAGCAECFDHFLFRTQAICKEYPTKYRIKKSDFDDLIDRLPREERIGTWLDASARLLAARFDDETLLNTDKWEEIRIVPDAEWREEE